MCLIDLSFLSAFRLLFFFSLSFSLSLSLPFFRFLSFSCMSSRHLIFFFRFFSLSFLHLRTLPSKCIIFSLCESMWAQGTRCFGRACFSLGGRSTARRSSAISPYAALPGEKEKRALLGYMREWKEKKNQVWIDKLEESRCKLRVL